MATMEGVSIPEDLIINKILPWLPAKSLMRFRSVCKAWNSEIPTRRFAELHRERSQPKICKVVATSISRDYAYRYDCSDFITIQRLTDDGFLECCYFRMPWLEGCRLVASSRDLIVFSYEAGYLLSNPATEDLLDLPPASWHEAAGYTCYTHRAGFGFVSSLGKYKLVSITSRTQDAHVCEVFTVGIDDSWRRGKSPPFPVDTSYSMPYLNGNLHVLSYDLIDFAEFKDENWRVLVFNLEDETWSAKELPGVAEKKHIWMACQVREMRGSLCFICSIPGETIDVWVMRDYANNVWSKHFVIDGTHLDTGIKKSHGFPLQVMSDGRIFIEMTDGRQGRS